MICLRWTAAATAIVVIACGALAERPPEEKKDAQVVVTGKLAKITENTEKIGAKKDGVLAHYEAELKVAAVEKGDGIKAGDTLKITWIYVPTKPSGDFVGAFGHDYKVKQGDQVEAYLMKRAGGKLEVLYNPAGMVKK
jgi:hypothetical protein